MSRFHELITGFHGFRNEYLLKDKEFFEQLAHGQSPKTLVIACCDSRTDPAIILGCKPGDLLSSVALPPLWTAMDSTRRPPCSTAAAVSSQELSMASSSALGSSP